MASPKVHIFWDNSNIFIAAKKVAQNKDGVMAKNAVRVHFESLYNLARAGRTVESAIAVGSVPPDQRRMWDQFKRSGVKLELFERGANSQTEQAVDQAIQVYMLRALAVVSKDVVHSLPVLRLAVCN